MTNPSPPLVALVGERRDSERAHARIEQVLPALGLRYRWYPTETITDARCLADIDAVWVVPGSPYRSMSGALTAIRHARETGVPFLGTCGGFQHALIEWARNVMGLTAADDVQSAPDAEMPLITPLTCSLRGERHPLHIAAGSRLAAVYGRLESEELYHCCYGLNPRFDGLFRDGELALSAWDDEKAPRAVELPGHPFFIGTLYQPELVSDGRVQHQLIRAFAQAALVRVRPVPEPGVAGLSTLFRK